MFVMGLSVICLAITNKKKAHNLRVLENETSHQKSNAIGNVVICSLFQLYTKKKKISQVLQQEKKT